MGVGEGFMHLGALWSEGSVTDMGPCRGEYKGYNGISPSLEAVYRLVLFPCVPLPSVLNPASLPGPRASFPTGRRRRGVCTTWARKPTVTNPGPSSMRSGERERTVSSWCLQTPDRRVSSGESFTKTNRTNRLKYLTGPSIRWNRHTPMVQPR